MYKRFAFVLFSSLLLAGAAQAGVITAIASLSGSNESPPNSSLGTGNAIFTIDTIANTIRLQVNFSGLGSNDTAAHIHCCTAAPFTGTAGVATTIPAFAGFPLGGLSGSYDQTLDLTNSSFYNPAFVTANSNSVSAAETTLLNGINAGTTYFNIHTVNIGGGEIRGFIQVVPEPGTIVMMAAGMLGLLCARKRLAGR